jgi:thiamine biosynthesis lipoprotein
VDTVAGVVEQRFRAMGSDIHLIVVGGTAEHVAAARDRIDLLESRWSRFRPDSEVSVLNAAGGRPTVVSADTRLLIERSIDAWRLTGGGFDPTLLAALQQAGYDRTFDDIDAADAPGDDTRAGDVGSLPDVDVTRPECTDIVFDGRSVALPVGMGFDPGGIGKGLAADLVAAELVDAGAQGVCVNMGGDLRVLGQSPTGTGWTLAIDHPWCTAPIAMVGLWEGAVATSSVLRRVWSVGGRSRHHLIDPVTGRPSTSDLALASVIAGEAWMAEVLAKAVLLRGTGRAFDLLDESTAALTVDHDGRITASAGFASFLGGVPLPEAVIFDQRVANEPGRGRQ